MTLLAFVIISYALQDGSNPYSVTGKTVNA